MHFVSLPSGHLLPGSVYVSHLVFWVILFLLNWISALQVFPTGFGCLDCRSFTTFRCTPFWTTPPRVYCTFTGTTTSLGTRRYVQVAVYTVPTSWTLLRSLLFLGHTVRFILWTSSLSLDVLLRIHVR